jgi:hypothetical protein
MNMKENIKMNSKEAKDITGGLTGTSKMPCPSYSLPAQACKMGSKLVSIKGSVCEGCYALKGFYRFKQGRNARDVRLASIYNPKWVSAMSFLVKNRKDNAFFRWHDSGDIQSIMHLGNIMTVAKNTPDTKHWLPTREYKLLTDYVEGGLEIPSNMYVRVSTYMIDGVPPLEFARKLNEHDNVEGFIGVSSVSKDKDEANCPAYNQGGMCGDCRVCWTTKENITYPFH